MARATVAPVVLLLAALLLAGCGFRPLYGEGQRVNAPDELAEIEVLPIEDRGGQILYNKLTQLLTPRGGTVRPAYTLHVDYNENVQELAFRKDQFATRGNLRLHIRFTLFSERLKTSILTGAETTVASFNIVSSEYATQAAREDAFQRAADAAAHDIQTRLAVFFLQRQQASTASPRPQ